MEPTLKIDVTRRLSTRAVLAGLISTISILFLFISLGGGFGLWKYDLYGVLQLEAGIWFYMLAALSISLYIGGFVAALSTHSSSMRDGNLHGFVTWAVVCVAICAFLFSGASGLVFSQMTPSLYFLVFIGDIIALAAAMTGASNGAKSELILEDKERERIRTLESQRLNQAYPRP